MIKSGGSRGIAYSAMIGAILSVVKLVLSFLPNVELVSPLIILFSSLFGLLPTLFGVIVFVIFDSIIYGFFPLVTLQYAFHFPLLAILSYFILKKSVRKDLASASIVFVFAIMFWIETPVINALFRFSPFLPTLISGIPFMIPMLIVGTVFNLFLFSPIYNAMRRRFNLGFPDEAENSEKLN